MRTDGARLEVPSFFPSLLVLLYPRAVRPPRVSPLLRPLPSAAFPYRTFDLLVTRQNTRFYKHTDQDHSGQDSTALTVRCEERVQRIGFSASQTHSSPTAIFEQPTCVIRADTSGTHPHRLLGYCDSDKVKIRLPLTRLATRILVVSVSQFKDVTTSSHPVRTRSLCRQANSVRYNGRIKSTVCITRVLPIAPAGARCGRDANAQQPAAPCIELP